MAQQGRGALIPLLIIGWIFFAPNAGRPPPAPFEQRPTVEDVILEEERSLSVLRNSSYGDLNSQYAGVLNLTGLEDDRGYAWEGLPLVQDRAKERLGYALGGVGRGLLYTGEQVGVLPPLYNNVTGHVHGRWAQRSEDNIRVPQLNLSSYSPVNPFSQQDATPFGRNITASDGDISIRLYERTPYELDPATGQGNITGISAEMVLQESGSGEEIELQLFGVYNIQLGQALLTTTSDKMAGIFMLPHFALSQPTFESAKATLNQSITRTIQNQRIGNIFSLNPWPSNVDGLAPSPFDPPQCELIVYLQQLSPSGQRKAYSSSGLLAFMEQELRFPTGAFLPAAPEMQFSMYAFSPDCGYVLESKGQPDYGSIDGDHLKGPKTEVLRVNGRHHLLLFSLTIGGQIASLMRQMREASTPSTRSRISFYTVSMLALGDGFAAMSFLLISLTVAGLWVNLIATAFLAFASVLFFGMRFLQDIWTAQGPERAIAARAEAEEERQRQVRFRATLDRLRAERLERLAAAAALNPDAPAAIPPADTVTAGTEPAPADTTPALPLPVTAQRPAVLDLSTALAQIAPEDLPLGMAVQRPTDTGATPVFMPSDQEGLVAGPGAGAQPATAVELRSASLGSIYTRFYLFLLATIFMSLNAASWPGSLRRAYFTVLGFLYLAFWVPQIKRNVQRNCRKALTFEFVTGQSLLRLVPFVYFYAYPHNVLFAGRQLYSLTFLAVWLWIQIVVLASQEIIGPRWFVRKGWAPDAYDYHPVLREDEEGNTMPLGLAEATSNSTPTSPLVERRASVTSPTSRRGSVVKEMRGKGKRVYDCAICFQDLEVPVIEAGGSSDATLAGGLLARRNYMVTPCRHIFHSACLEGWMKYRLQCPICRETLPPQ